MERPHRAEPELTGLQVAAVVQQVVRIHLERCDLAGDGKKPLANACQFDAVALPMEKHHVVLALQGLHLRGQRGLAQPDGTRRGTETSVLGDGEEGTEFGG